MSTASPITLSRLAHQPTHRHTTGLDSVDWVYGSTEMSGSKTSWGLPVGGVSLWAGAAGCGKSRLAVKLASTMSLNRKTILYIQSEVELGQFRGWFGEHGHDADRISVLDSADAGTIIAAIGEHRPSLVIIDSISMIDGMERPTVAKRVMAELKRAAADAHAHIVLVGHLNSEGKVKGGSSMPHLVDTVATMSRGHIEGWVRFRIDKKHRFGPTDRYIIWNHEDRGLRPVFAGDHEWPMM